MKPLLFLVRGDIGTFGDEKPLAILAVFAAAACQLPVHLRLQAFDDPQDPPEWLSGIKRFAAFVLGSEVTFRLKISISAKKDIDYDDEKYKNVTIIDSKRMDFGASRGENRFVTHLFPFQTKRLYNDDFTMIPINPKKSVFGGVMLPIDERSPYWSDPKIVEQLIDFRTQNKHRRLVALAGSRKSPYPLADIISWARDHGDWCFVLIGYFYNLVKSNGTEPFLNTNQFLFFEYIEFEDLVRVSDAFISNCGAGSIQLAFAAGVVQTCEIAESIGPDKPFNQKAMEDLKIGPIHQGFAQVMNDIVLHFETYQTNAIRIKHLVSNEMKQMVRNMYSFFADLEQDQQLQEVYDRREIIPAKYALPLVGQDESVQKRTKVGI